MSSSSSSLLSWLTSHTCSSTSVILYQNHTSLSIILQWVGFIFLSPCPQRALFATVDIIFLLLLAAFCIHKLLSRTHFSGRVNGPYVRTSVLFKACLVLTALLAICYAVLSIIAFTKLVQSSWELKEAMFWLIQAMTQIAIVVLLTQETRFKYITHPITLRIYWMVNFVLVGLFSASAIIRLSYGEEQKELELDDIFSLISLPVSAVLLVVAIRGSSGITVTGDSGLKVETESPLKEPLLSKSDVTGYASASLVSRAMWIWMNPLLEKGYKSPLKIDDIPLLSREHNAQVTSELFESNWPKPEEKSNHPVRLTLIRCFWKDLVWTAVLALIRLSVMYVGPVLLQGFVSFSAGKGSSPYEGYYLVGGLLASKFIEVLVVVV